MSKEIQSKAQAARVTIERDSPPGYACLTLSEKQANGRYKAVETLCIPNDTIGGVMDALRDLFAPIAVDAIDIRVGDVLVAWRIVGDDKWSTIGLRGDTRVTSRGVGVAFIANGDRINLDSYQWQIRRSP